MRIGSPDSVLSQSTQTSLAPTCQCIRRRRHAYCVSVVPLLTAGCVPAFSQGCPPAPSMPIKMEKEERRASPKAAEALSRSCSLWLLDSFRKSGCTEPPKIRGSSSCELGEVPGKALHPWKIAEHLKPAVGNFWVSTLLARHPGHLHRARSWGGRS